MSLQPVIDTARTCIRLPEAEEAPALLAFRRENRQHLSPWEPQRDESYYTLAQCRQTITEGHQAAALDRGYPLGVFGRDESEIIATLTFANIVRGPFQACLLGYGVASRWQGRGLMHEALEAALNWAFGGLQLHRVMANYLPRNERSGRLLARLGFEREGYARRYLKIAGCWEDHILTARIREPD